jgi:hypothetical protein
MLLTVVELETVKLTVTCCPVFAGLGVALMIVTEGFVLVVVQMFVLVMAAVKLPLALPAGPP